LVLHVVLLDNVPEKIRELESRLQRAGFFREPGKGSQRTWVHDTGVQLTMSGKAGDDAQHYQIKKTNDALRQVGHKEKTKGQ
jgi:predicted RNA binding protein YcfA (HicA-like mRNA interferase family)